MKSESQSTPAKARKAKRQRIEARQDKVAELYIQGKAMGYIAGIVGVSTFQVSKDLEHIRERWQANASMKFGMRQAQELAKIDEIERVSWEAYEKSKEDEVTVVVSKDKIPRIHKNGLPKNGGNQNTPSLFEYDSSELETIKSTRKVTRRGQATGDERWIARVCWCIEMRCRILDLIKPEQNTTNIVQINWDEMTGDRQEEKDSIEDTIAQKLGKVRVEGKVIEPREPAGPGK